MFTQVYGGSYEVISRQRLNLISGSTPIVLNDPAQLYESSSSDKVDRSFGIRLIYNKSLHKDISTRCNVSFKYRIEGYLKSGSLAYTSERTLEINYNTTTSSAIDVPMAVDYFTGTAPGAGSPLLTTTLPALPPIATSPDLTHIYYVKVTPISVTYSDATLFIKSHFSDLPSDVELEVFCQNTKYTNLSTGTSINHRFEDHQLLLYWGNVVGAESYDVEWVHIDYHDENYADCVSGIGPDPFTLKTPVRINTSEGYYNLDATYTKGAIFYRYRPVGIFTGSIEADGSTHRRVGGWTSTNESSSPGMVIINDGSGTTVDAFENERTWQLVKSYAEEGKNKKVISYYDDTYRNRQSVTNLSTNSTIAVAENKYDYEGRSVLSILPSPVQTTDLHYQADFNQIAIVGGFHKDKYDGNSKVPELDDAMGSSKYYSPNIPTYLHSVNMDYIADAGGYPYSRVEFKRDNTGKPTAQSGVGLFHQVQEDNGKETRYYYATPSSTKLHRLFGSNAGNASMYKTQLVKDANGQLSLSYIDPSSRTIATSLLGESPDNVQVLDDNAAVNITENLSDNNKYDAASNSTRIDFTFFNEIPTTTYDFTYSMGSILNKAGNPCPDCRYELTISLVDEEGKAMPLASPYPTMTSSSIVSGYTVNTSPTPTIPQITAIIDPPATTGPANCNIFGLTGDGVLNDVPLTFRVVASKIGEYHIIKVLKILQPDINEDLTTYAASGASPTIPSLTDAKDAYEESVDVSMCDIT